MQEMYILGAGGFAREVAWAALNDKQHAYVVKGFLSDSPEEHGQSRCGFPVVGSLQFLDSLSGSLPWVICGVGSPSVRRSLVSRMRRDVPFATVVHRSVEFWPEFVRMGHGSVICAGTMLTADIDIGVHVNINLNCTVGHDARIGDYCNLSPGVHISGGVRLGHSVDIGTGVCVLPKVSIGEGAVIGAGAVVKEDIPPYALAVGVPAQVKKILATPVS